MRRALILLSAFFAVAYQLGDSSWQAIWVERWMLLLYIVSVVFIYQRLKPRTPLLCALIFFLGQALISSHIPAFHINDISQELSDASMGFVVTCFAFVFYLGLRIRFAWLFFHALVPMLAMGVLLSSHIGDPHIQVPFLSNPSMSGILIALFAPFLYWPIALLCAAALCLMGALTPILVFLAVCIWLHTERHLRAALMVGGAWAGLHLLFAGHDNGRLPMWGMAMQYFFSQDMTHILFGLGGGTSAVYLPYVQMVTHHDNQPAWLWLHNDYLQGLFEFGVAGVVLAASVAGDTFHRLSRRDQAKFVGLAVAMTANFPLHWPLHTLILWELMRRAHGVPNSAMEASA